jgi:hypothetical protein
LINNVATRREAEMSDIDSIATGLDGNDPSVLRKLDALGLNATANAPKAIAQFGREGAEAADWQGLNQAAGSTFAEIFQAELDALDARPGSLDSSVKPARLQDVNRRAQSRKLAGLALSGGGARSATFNLGVIQALAEKRLLREFDFMSTVSGGGFIGGWLSRLVAAYDGKVELVEEALSASPNGGGKVEHDAIQFLRKYSNYMAPRLGFLSADTWTLLITYVRNTMLNMAMVGSWLACLFLLPRLVTWCAGASLVYWPAHVRNVSIVSFLVAVFFIAHSISRKGSTLASAQRSQSQGGILLIVCLPLSIAALGGSLTVWTYQDALAAFWRELDTSFVSLPALLLLVPGTVYFCVWCAGWLTAQIANQRARRRTTGTDGPDRRNSWALLGRDFIGHLLCAVGSLAIGTVLLLKIVDLFKGHLKSAEGFTIVAVVTFGVPAMQILFGITLTLMIGLLGRLYSDQSREWWARLGGWIGIIAFAWTALFSATFYLPPLLHWAYDHYPKTAGSGGLMSFLLTYAGLRAGSSAETGKIKVSKHYDTLARLAPLAFSILAVAGLSALLQILLFGFQAPITDGKLFAYIARYLYTYPPVISPYYPPKPVLDALKLMALFGLAAVILGSRLDINKFSLYMMYRMRLVRAYFGASSRERSPHPFTGFDPADDPELTSLLKAAPGVAGLETLQRPYHIINAALNLVGGKDLAWQTRKAANFIFTPKFCGFEAPSLAPAQQYESSWRGAYRPSSDYASTSSMHDERERIKLGAAVAISGAAASPNMGYHSSPPLAFLMTLFNLRLGRWCPNPMKKNTWRLATPRVALFSILAELFGHTDMTADFLYLSDGGHFENLGLYELVRRRCRLIVVIDASADAQSHFEDLGNAIRRCATDFHIPIELNPRGIQRFDGGTGIGSSWVTGRVQYARADGCGRDGLLVYIKPTIVGDENADILNYSKTHPEFPHQHTADQFFDENQFESYRSLGYQTAMRAIKQMHGLERGRASWQGALRRHRIERICTLLRLDELRARGRLRREAPGTA